LDYFLGKKSKDDCFCLACDVCDIQALFKFIVMEKKYFDAGNDFNSSFLNF
jgi:hypothetical protein